MDLHRRSPLQLYDYDVAADGQGGNLRDCVAADDGKVRGGVASGPRGRRGGSSDEAAAAEAAARLLVRLGLLV
jgi:hypothetical protein